MIGLKKLLSIAGIVLGFSVCANASHQQVGRDKVLICGAGGFIGGHLSIYLKKHGYFVRGVDIKQHEYLSSDCFDEFIIGDLRDKSVCDSVIDDTVTDVYQLAADMGGAEYLFTGKNDADVMANSCLINLNVLKTCIEKKVKRILFTSSACVYPEYNQLEPDNPKCSEDSVYPAAPDSEYGWEKLFGERLYFAHGRNYGLQVKVARLHNVFGPYGTWFGGKEKAPAALCRKVVAAADNSEIEIFGSGEQTRSFLYVDECVEGLYRLMNSDFSGPVNIGSEELISINDFAKMIIAISGKNLYIRHTDGPIGVMGRKSDNKVIKEKLNWVPDENLEHYIKITYEWIKNQYEDLYEKQVNSCHYNECHISDH